MAVVSYSEFKNNPANYFLVVFNIEALRNDGYKELTAIAGFDWYWDDHLIDDTDIDIRGSYFKGAATGWIRYVRKGVYLPLTIRQEIGLWIHTADYSVVFDRAMLTNSNESISVDEMSKYLTAQIKQTDNVSISAAPEFIKHAVYKHLIATFDKNNKHQIPTPEMLETQRRLDSISLQSIALASTKAAECALKQLQAYHHFLDNALDYISASFSVPTDTPHPIVPSGFDFKRADRISGGLVNFRFEAIGDRQILVPYQLGNTTTTAVYRVNVKSCFGYRTILLAEIKKIVGELTGLDGLEVKVPDSELLGYPELNIEYVKSHKVEHLTQANADTYNQLDAEAQNHDINLFFVKKRLADKQKRQIEMAHSNQKYANAMAALGSAPAEAFEGALLPETGMHTEPENDTTTMNPIFSNQAVVSTEPLQYDRPDETDQPQASETAVAKHQVKCLFPQNATVRYTAADAHNLSLIDYGPLILDKLKAECPALADALAKDELSEVLYWDRFCLKLNELLQLSQLFVQLQKEPSFKQHTVSFFMSAAGKNKDEAAEFDRFSKMDVLQTLLKQQNFPIARLVVHAGFENKRHDRILQLIFVSGARFELNFSYGMAFFDVTLPDDMATAIAEVNNEKDAKKRKAMLGPMLAELQVDFRPLGVLGKSASMTIAVAGFSPVMPAAQQD
ncbi:hypothetical protein [Rheinheimera sp. F8]|uniref:hypothetical protein n=1 Tax=Rheinheimera sp. F8 TaxID=1763998 RepID=UPI00074491AA|nr:hypothetical protein [Rheinheimera sp. F8]ALZ76715.1 hypothetical protein ATY27_13735 [Rheinheimera sp. F8]